MDHDLWVPCVCRFGRKVCFPCWNANGQRMSLASLTNYINFHGQEFSSHLLELRGKKPPVHPTLVNQSQYLHSILGPHSELPHITSASNSLGYGFDFFLSKHLGPTYGVHSPFLFTSAAWFPVGASRNKKSPPLQHRIKMQMPEFKQSLSGSVWNTMGRKRWGHPSTLSAHWDPELHSCGCRLYQALGCSYSIKLLLDEQSDLAQLSNIAGVGVIPTFKYL